MPFNYYLITDPQYYSNNVKVFEQKLRVALETKRVDIACFRDKTSSNTKELATVFINTCKEYHIKNIFINQNINLAKELNYDGVHLTSTQFDKIEEAKNTGLKTIISCHTYEEIEKAIELQAKRKEAETKLGAEGIAKGNQCDKCGAMAVVRLDNCNCCLECGDSKCG